MPTAKALLSAFCGCWLCAGFNGAAQAALPDAPAGHVLDMARALPVEAVTTLSVEVEKFRAETGCEFWLFATSFVEPGANIRGRAKELRRAWSPTGKAVLLGYDRSTASYTATLSPELWAAYSTPQVVQMLQDVGGLIGKEQDPLDQRLIAASNLVMQRLAAMQKVRVVQNQLWPRQEVMLAGALLTVLICGGILARILSARRRVREAYESEVFYFPDVEVATRFGAPFGGGVIAELGVPPKD